MDVVARLRRFAFARPHLLVLASPGATGVRLAVERFAREHGWPMAASPADADALVEAGRLDEDLSEVADLVHRQLPAPAARLALTEAAEVDERLAELPRLLARWHGSSDPVDQAQPELPMADRAEDRDGLSLDVLHVPLGPLLPYWPAGLRLALDLQGDVVQRAELTELGVSADIRPFWGRDRRSTARGLDATGRLLAVAGWHSMSARCQVLRDRVLGGEQDQRAAADIDAAARRIRRSRLLHAALTGLGPVDGAGDAADRLRGWLAELSGGETVSGEPSSAECLAMLPRLVTGHELAAVRLIVASFDVDLAEAASRRAGAPDG